MEKERKDPQRPNQTEAHVVVKFSHLTFHFFSENHKFASKGQKKNKNKKEAESELGCDVKLGNALPISCLKCFQQHISM